MKIIGVILASLGASLWAISGISGEILFKEYDFSSNWMVSIRTLVAGSLLLGIAKFIKKTDIFLPFRNKKDRLGLILFGILGMYLVQMTYFKTIELSNVSFATILQFTAPFYIFIYESIKNKQKPSFFTIILLFLIALGVALISTKGNINNFSGSIKALIMGILSAIMIAFYSIQPRYLLKKYSSIVVVGWGMIIGSLFANIFHPFWKIEGIINANSLLNVFIVVILGTTMAYLLYIMSLKHISSSLAGILTAFEPVLATILSMFIFNFRLSVAELIGFVLVFGCIFILEKRL